MLCDDLERWNERVGGRLRRKGICMYIWLIHDDVQLIHDDVKQL